MTHRNGWKTRALLAAIAAAIGGAAGCEAPARPEQGAAEAGAARPYYASALLAQKLDDELRKFMAHPYAAGVSAVVTKGDTILWSGARGMADPDRGIPWTEATPVQIASVNKMITATAVMQLWERGALGLDDDVNAYLPFKVRNPAFPDAPITLRMLLSHGSSIGDNFDMIPYYWGTDPDVSLGRFLRGYFDPRSPGYDPAQNWLPYPPGAAWTYSNIGFDLAGYIVERVAKMPIDEYCRRHILDPLGMSGGFYLRDFGPGEIQPAVPSYYDPATRAFVGYGQYTVPLIASGMLMTDATSLARFLLMRVNGGQTAGFPRVIEPETNALMHQPVFNLWGDPRSGYGLGLFLFPDYGWGPLTGHGGGDYGISTMAIYAENDHVGIVILTNGEVNLDVLLAPLLDAVRGGT